MFTFTTKTQPDLARQQVLVDAGPVVLGFEEFKFVSGGTPKGSWGIAGAEIIEAKDLEAPKGTW